MATLLYQAKAEPTPLTFRRLVVDGVGGQIAIYDVSTLDPTQDNAPLSTPLSYIPRLHFHSALEYPRIISTYTGSVTLPSIGINTVRTAGYTIAAHGLAGTPYVEGKVQVGGNWYPLAGSTVVAQQNIVGNGFSLGFVRMLALGADTTNITLQEYSVSCLSAPGYGSLTLNYEIYLTDTLL